MFSSSSPMSPLLYSAGASGLHLTKHENFHGGLDAISVGDGLFTILTTLSKRATSVQVMLQPILTYMACGYMGRQVSSILCRVTLFDLISAQQRLQHVSACSCRALCPPASCLSLCCGSSCECWTQVRHSRPFMTWVGIIHFFLTSLS